MNLLKIISIIVCLFLFTGCIREKEVIVEKPVFVPSKCDINIPQRPHSEIKDVNYLRKILIYTDQLECDLYFCVTGETKSECHNFKE